MLDVALVIFVIVSLVSYLLIFSVNRKIKYKMSVNKKMKDYL